MKRFTKSIPTPNEWLAELVDQRGISHNRLARMVELDATLVQRWISGREQIPSYHLAEIVRLISTPEDFTYALSLKYCEDFTNQLRKQIKKLTICTDDIDNNEVELAVSGCLEKLLSQEVNLKQEEKIQVAAKHLTDANFAIRTWVQAAEEDFLSPLFSSSNIARHLRYPVNHFAGLLLELPSIQERGLTNLRRIIENRKVRLESDMLSQHHAVHMLVRHGTDSDRMRIKELLLRGDISHTPMMRSLGFVGLMLVEGDSSMIEHFLFEWERDQNLANVNSLFDAIHYGDVVIDAHGRVPTTTEFNGAILHILRHLEQPRHYQNILGLELRKLLHILEEAGSKPFLNPHILSRLGDVFFSLSEIEIPLDEDGSVRKEFNKHFKQVFEMGLSQGLLTPQREPGIKP